MRENSRFRFVQGDICDQALVENVLREEGLDGIVNLAAETHVDRSIQNADVFLRSNLLGVMALLEAARNVWCTGSGVNHRFHQVSTDEVFGPLAPDAPLREESQPYAPQSPYSASKAAADHLVMAWRNTYGVQASISYSSNVYGPRQHPEKLIPLAISRLLDGLPVPVYGDGHQVRSWIFVQDLCRALGQFLTGNTVGCRLFLGADEECTNLQLLQTLFRVMGIDPDSGLLEHVADRPGHDRRYGLSSRVFRRLSGFAPSVPLQEGLVDTFNWYRERRARSAAPG
jgi:dTDP-glucose 4,6-dehydratase